MSKALSDIDTDIFEKVAEIIIDKALNKGLIVECEGKVLEDRYRIINKQEKILKVYFK